MKLMELVELIPKVEDLFETKCNTNDGCWVDFSDKFLRKLDRIGDRLSDYKNLTHYFEIPSELSQNIEGMNSALTEMLEFSHTQLANKNRLVKLILDIQGFLNLTNDIAEVIKKESELFQKVFGVDVNDFLENLKIYSDQILLGMRLWLQNSYPETFEGNWKISRSAKR